MSSIFPEKLSISENKSQTLNINEAALLITAAGKGFWGKKMGQLFKNLELSRQVDLTGNKSNQIWSLLESIFKTKPLFERYYNML